MKTRLTAVVLALAAAIVTQVSCARTQSRGGGFQARRIGTFSAQPVEHTAIRAGSLLQSPVSSEGGSLGKVEDLVIDPESGQVQFVLVSKGFMMGNALGEVIVPIPWQAINLSSRRQFVVHVDQERLGSDDVASRSAGGRPGYALHIFGFLESPEDQGGSGQGDVESGHGQGQSEALPETRRNKLAPDEL